MLTFCVLNLIILLFLIQLCSLGCLVYIGDVSGLEMTAGVVFRKMKDTIISENEWKVVLDFDMREMKKELFMLKNMYADVALTLLLTFEMKILNMNTIGSNWE